MDGEREISTSSIPKTGAMICANVDKAAEGTFGEAEEVEEVGKC